MSRKSNIMSAFGGIIGARHAAGKPEQRTASHTASRRGFTPAVEGSHDTLGGAALTMLLVLYPALASVVVALAAFLLRGTGSVV